MLKQGSFMPNSWLNFAQQWIDQPATIWKYLIWIGCG